MSTLKLCGKRKNGDPGAKTAATHKRRQENCSDIENKPHRTTPTAFRSIGKTKVAKTPNSDPTPRTILRMDSLRHCVYAYPVVMAPNDITVKYNEARAKPGRDTGCLK